MWRPHQLKTCHDVVGSVSLLRPLVLVELVLMVSDRLVGPRFHGCFPGGATPLVTSAAASRERSAKT